MNKFDDESFFEDSEENGYAIQICRDSIRMSGNTDQELPYKKSAVLDKILQEPENFLLNQKKHFYSEKTSNDEKSTLSNNVLHAVIGNKNGNKKTG